MPIKETALMTVGKLGCVVDGEALTTMLIALIDHIADNELSLRGIAYDALCCVARSHGHRSVASMVEKYREQVYPHLVPSLLRTPECLEESVQALFEVDGKTFLESAAPIALPRLIIARDTELLETLARWLEYDTLSSLLLDEQKPYLPNCLLYLLTTADPDLQLTPSVEFLRQVLDKKPSELFTIREADLLNQLFLLLGDEDCERASKGSTGIKIVINSKQQTLRISSSSSEHETGEYLSKMFLRIAFFIECTLKDPSKRVQVVRSFNVLLRKVHQHLKGLRPKVVATLKKLMAYAELQGEACRAWDTFVRKLDTRSLGSVLADVVVNLLPFLHHRDTVHTVVGIFEYLLVTHRTEVQDHLHEIPLLPDIPELQAVRRVHCQDSKVVDLKGRLTSLMAAVAHDNLEVRLSALSQLRQELASNRAQLNSWTLDFDFADPIIAKLLDTLLHACKHGYDSEIARLCAEVCLPSVNSLSTLGVLQLLLFGLFGLFGLFALLSSSSSLLLLYSVVLW
jgi:serine/threonine-protein kinase ATR